MDKLNLTGTTPIRDTVAAVRRDACAEVAVTQLKSLYVFLSANMPVDAGQMRLDKAIKDAMDVAKEVAAEEALTDKAISKADDEFSARMRDAEAVERAAARAVEEKV